MRILSVGHAAFAAMMIVLGTQGLIRGDFAAIWQPVPKGVPAREVLAWLCAVISLGCGAGLLWRRTATTAARVLLAALLAWLLAFRLPAALRAPAEAASWESCGETAVLVAGAWVLAVWFSADRDGQHAGPMDGVRGIRFARVLYGLALMAFGLAHFAYLEETAALVPGWLPAHVAWVILTGSAYLAAGAAVLTGAGARLAAALAAVQMGLFTLLVWAPRVAKGSASAFQRDETLISLALTAAAWVLADSYRGLRPLALAPPSGSERPSH